MANNTTYSPLKHWSEFYADYVHATPSTRALACSSTGGQIGVETLLLAVIGSSMTKAAIEEVMDHLRVDADGAYNTSRAVGNDAQELREELAGLQRN
jgi:hypothetical protein